MKISDKHYKDLCKVFRNKICIFSIWGYSNFKKPEHYEVAFSGASATVWNVKAYTAWSYRCFVVGVELSTSKFDVYSGVTVYSLSSKLFSNISNLYNTVLGKAKK